MQLQFYAFLCNSRLIFQFCRWSDTHMVSPWRVKSTWISEWRTHTAVPCMTTWPKLTVMERVVVGIDPNAEMSAVQILAAPIWTYSYRSVLHDPIFCSAWRHLYCTTPFLYRTTLFCTEWPFFVLHNLVFLLYNPILYCMNPYCITWLFILYPVKYSFSAFTVISFFNGISRYFYSFVYSL